MAQVKICGLREAAHVTAAVEAGARYLGFVFFAKSPRAVLPAQAALLGRDVPPGVARVGLFVDPDDALLDEVLGVAPLDMIQLHGAETPQRVGQVRSRFGLPVMKALGIAEPADLGAIWSYGTVADMLLIDARPPRDAVLPGGNGLAFDWRLLVGRRWPRPWLLAGGLTPDNVAGAIALTGAPGVDVSSGVETAPGVKDAGLIRDFVAQALT